METVPPPVENSVTTSDKYEYAGFGSRLLAYGVDFLILFLIGLVVQPMLGIDPFAVFNAQTMGELDQLQKSISGSLSNLISIGLGLTFYLIMWVSYDGATPGKKLMAIKIIRTDGSKITYPVGFIRYLGYMVSAFVLLLGYLWIIWDKRKQGWHDKIAGTYVVKTGEKPKTFIAIILFLLALLTFSGYFGAAMYKGFQLGIEGSKKTSIRPSVSFQENKDNMPSEAKEHYDKALVLFKQMQTLSDPEQMKPIADETITESKSAVDADPNNPLLWANLGDAYGWPNTLGTADDSLNSYKKAEELDPENIIYTNYVGDQLIRMGEYEDAILQFQKTLRKTDNSGFAHLSIGIAYKELKINDEARSHFEKAVAIFEKQNTTGQFDDEILQAQKEMSSLP